MAAAPDIMIPTARELTIVRLIDAPRALVFRAWTDPAWLARWWGPAGFSNSFEAFELRAGGTWRFVMHGPDGVDHPNLCQFTDVVDQQRIVFDHLSEPRFEMTLTFTDHGERTALGWRQRFATAEDCRRMAPIASPANEQNLDRLAALLHATA